MIAIYDSRPPMLTRSWKPIHGVGLVGKPAAASRTTGKVKLSYEPAALVLDGYLLPEGHFGFPRGRRPALAPSTSELSFGSGLLAEASAGHLLACDFHV